MIRKLIISLENLVASLREKYPAPATVLIDQTIPPPAVKVTIVHVSQVSNFVLGIEKAEGFPHNAGAPLNNSCDLKFTEYTKSLGATGRSPANFCIFPSYHVGLAAAVQLVTDACNGKLIAYYPSMTINEFCKIFAEPPVLSAYVSKAISLCTKVDGLTSIKALL